MPHVSMSMREPTTSSYDAGSLKSQDFLPYCFRNQRLFHNALTAGDSNSIDREGHRSLAQLGDSLIGFVLMSEGFDRGLSRQEQQAASSYYRRKDVCSMLARARRLDQMVRISDRQIHQGPQPTVLKNTLAAIVGAVWADSRDYVAVRQVMGSLGLVNDIDIVVDPSNIMLSDSPQTLMQADESEALDWSIPDPVHDAQDPSIVAQAQIGHPAFMCDGVENLPSEASTSFSSPVMDFITPGSSNDDHAARAQAHDTAASSYGEHSNPSTAIRGKGYQKVLESYMGREMTRLGNADTFSQHYRQFAEYQHALHALELPEAQKKTAARLITAVGDCSALLLLKGALLHMRDDGFIPVKAPSIPDRLRIILELESSAENTRLIYWLHLYELLQEISRQVDADIAEDETSSNARCSPKKIGNPQNQRQTRISQLMLANMPPNDANDRKTKRLRRIAHRLLLLVKQWNGYGILALLGADFNTPEMMTLTDSGFKQVLDLLWRLEGGRILKLSCMAASIVHMVQNGRACDARAVLELASEDHILSLPRLSAGMEDLLDVV